MTRTYSSHHFGGAEVPPRAVIINGGTAIIKCGDPYDPHLYFHEGAAAALDWLSDATAAVLEAAQPTPSPVPADIDEVRAGDWLRWFNGIHWSDWYQCATSPEPVDLGTEPLAHTVTLNGFGTTCIPGDAPVEFHADGQVPS